MLRFSTLGVVFDTKFDVIEKKFPVIILIIGKNNKNKKKRDFFFDELVIDKIGFIKYQLKKCRLVKTFFIKMLTRILLSFINTKSSV